MIRLMRALTGKRTRDEGFSLIEVVIAAVILGLVSVALLNGLSTLNLASKLQKTPSKEYANLATAQVLVQRTAFTACSTNANPYATALNTQLTALNVTIASIKGIPASDTTKWYTCGSSWPVDGSGVQTAAPTVLQQITLQATIGRQSTRTVFKASNGAYPVGTDGTSVFSVTTTVSGTLGNVVNIPSGCSPSLCTGSATLGATAYPATATSGNMVYFIMGSNPTDVTSAISSTTLSLTDYTAGGAPWVLVGAFDKTTNTLARPMRVYLNLISVPKVSVAYSPAAQTALTALVGYGIYPTTQTATVTATLPAGYTSPTFSTTSTQFTVTASTGNNATVAMATGATLTAGTISVPVSVSCCGFTDPNAKGTGSVSVNVTDKISMGGTPTLSTTCAHFLSTTSASPCVVTYKVNNGSPALAGSATCSTLTLPSLTPSTSMDWGPGTASCSYAAGVSTVTAGFYYTGSDKNAKANSSVCYNKTVKNNTGLWGLTFTDSVNSTTAVASTVSVTCVV